MSEQVFPSGDWQADDAWATNRVAELAELVVDQIMEPDHDWASLRDHTLELDGVTHAMARRYPRGADAPLH